MQNYLRQTNKDAIIYNRLQYAIEQFFLLFVMHSSIFIYNEYIFGRLVYYRKDSRIPVKK